MGTLHSHNTSLGTNFGFVGISPKAANYSKRIVVNCTNTLPHFNQSPIDIPVVELQKRNFKMTPIFMFLQTLLLVFRVKKNEYV